MKNIDELLKENLILTDELNTDLKKRILSRAAANEDNAPERSPVRHSSFRIGIAFAILIILAAAAFAAWKIRSAREVAEHFEDSGLAEAFIGESAWVGSEIQEYGGYKVSLIGLVSGKEISDHLVTSDGNVIKEGTYAVVTIEHSDGTPMPNTTDEAYDNELFLVSPYIEGYDPLWYNIFSFGNGGYSAFIENGVQYRLVHTANLEPFADHTIWLGVSDGTFYNRDAFLYDETSGVISRNEDYAGLNALFRLPIDPNKADPEKATQILRRMEDQTESEDQFIHEYTENEISDFINRLTPENFEELTEPIESTRRTLIPDDNGVYSYRYNLPDGSGGSGTSRVSVLFPEGVTGSPKIFSYSSSGNGLEGLHIETHMLNEDGTVTFVVCVPRLNK